MLIALARAQTARTNVPVVAPRPFISRNRAGHKIPQTGEGGERSDDRLEESVLATLLSTGNSS
jgi:hypothetical protein